ncbi:MAG: hypothetical protein P8179_24995 [Candidatus Thiodiazotropha sp.]|jgi:hypothetical protein
MDTSKLKSYAPKARRDFIAAVTRRAAKFGLTAKGASPIREEGQLAIIDSTGTVSVWNSLKPFKISWLF